MLLPQPILIATQKAIDHVFQMDPQGAAGFAELEGKVVNVEIEGLDINLYLILLSDGIELSRFHEGQADSTISGTPFALLRLLSDKKSLFNGSVTITGDTGVARKLSKAMEDFDVDWEEHISRVIGDTPTHHVFRLASGVRDFLSQGLSGFQSQTADYLENKSGMVVKEEEINRYCGDVDELRSRTDRFEARLALLESHTIQAD